MIDSLWELLTFSLSSLNVNIIWSYQNAARVKKPYLVVNYTTVDVPDHDHYSLVDETGIRINSAWRKAVVDLQFYCFGDSYKIASQAASLLASNASVDKQWLLDVSIGHRLFLSRVPALLNESQYEDRAIFQFEFYYTENMPDVVGRIETVIIDGNYPTGDSEVDADGNLIGGSESLNDLQCHHVVDGQGVYVDPRKTKETS